MTYDYLHIQVTRIIVNGIVNEKGIPLNKEGYKPLESIIANYSKYLLTLDYFLQKSRIKYENMNKFRLENKTFD